MITASVSDMYLKLAADLEWKDPPTEYYLTQVEVKILWTDKETDAIVNLMKFSPGILDRKHNT